jgi:hypothetical protein
MIPDAQAFSVWVVIVYCGCTILVRVMWRGAASFALYNRAQVSVTVAEARTAFMMEQWMWTTPLNVGGVESGLGIAVVGLSLRKKIMSALERALETERYDASLWMWRCIMLE